MERLSPFQRLDSLTALAPTSKKLFPSQVPWIHVFLAGPKWMNEEARPVDFASSCSAYPPTSSGGQKDTKPLTLANGKGPCRPPLADDGTHRQLKGPRLGLSWKGRCSACPLLANSLVGAEVPFLTFTVVPRLLPSKTCILSKESDMPLSLSPCDPPIHRGLFLPLRWSPYLLKALTSKKTDALRRNGLKLLRPCFLLSSRSLLGSGVREG
ncbi:hypothetical protein HAX54_014955 [Datura stramonium]|uniref:Uncharacterized protein n=1 Tax=Datura stramonium TaxID=4076 RepID=A0ABS8TNX3_DATST|nr:hypothetical protein [Datura stramonium]